MKMAEYMEYDWRAQSTSSSYLSYNEKFLKDLHDGGPKTEKALNDSLNALRRLAVNDLSTDVHLRSAAASESDESLKRFVRARKFDVEKTWKLLTSYERHKEVLNEMPSVSDEDIRSAFLDGLPGVLTDRDRRGRKVIILNAFAWDGSRYSIMAVYKALLITLEKLSYDEQNQINGFVLIIDWTGFPLRLSTQLGPRILRLMAEGLHDCFPARFKGIHFINRPWFVEAALLSLRGILSEKARRRLYQHGNNLSLLHEHMPRDILPTELGGEQGSYNPAVWIKEVETYLEKRMPSGDITKN